MNKELLALVESYKLIERMTKVTLYVTIDGKSYLAKDLYEWLARGEG